MEQQAFLHESLSHHGSMPLERAVIGYTVNGLR